LFASLHAPNKNSIKYRIREEKELITRGVLKPKPDVSPEEIKPQKSEHEQLINLICEIGEMLDYEAEREYTYGNVRLDVVWLRKPRIVPTHVFEIQLKGNLYQAISKLKRTHDIWGSKPFLVASGENIEKAMEIIEGSFYEIVEKLRVVDSQTIKEYYDCIKQYLEIHKEFETPP